MLVTW